MTTHEVLVAARNRIASEERWCQDQLVDGERLCASGALLAAHGFNPANALVFPSSLPGYAELKAAMGAALVSEWNDSHSHAEVLAAFDKAIAAAAPEPDVGFVTVAPLLERVGS